MRRNRVCQFGLVAVLSLGGSSVFLRGAELVVPNGSFESPKVVYVGTQIDSWQHSPKPDSYDESGGFTWEQLTGIFKNTPEGSADHVVNLDGEQALWLFAVPEVGLFQDYDSLGWADTHPSHAFDFTFETGHEYRLIVGVIGGGGGMLPGASLAIGLYYRDDASNVVTVASKNVVHSKELFPDRTHFVDFTVVVPMVRPGDPWAGKRIGVRMDSTVGADLQGGYWDLDNVRLIATQVNKIANPQINENRFEFTVQSEPGAKFQILSSGDLTLPTAEWSVLKTVTNEAGLLPFAEPVAAPRQFYLLKQIP